MKMAARTGTNNFALDWAARHRLDADLLPQCKDTSLTTLAGIVAAGSDIVLAVTLAPSDDPPEPILESTAGML
jgi:hypothetical protein